jgi:hypothetical protein
MPCTCNRNAGDDVNLYAAMDCRYNAQRSERIVARLDVSPTGVRLIQSQIAEWWAASVLYLLAWFAGEAPVSVCGGCADMGLGRAPAVIATRAATKAATTERTERME